MRKLSLLDELGCKPHFFARSRSWRSMGINSEIEDLMALESQVVYPVELWVFTSMQMISGMRLRHLALR
jgi:hypothetical protein